MKNKILLLIILAFVVSCSSGKINPNNRCNSALENNYKRIVYDNHISLTNNKENIYTEVRFECALGPSYIEKRMFEKYGNWTSSIVLRNNYHRVLIWEKVKLFENDDKLYNVAALGHESKKTIYTSVVVSDIDNYDVLKDDSAQRKKIVEYFSNMIKSNNSRDKAFYNYYRNVFHNKGFK